VTPEVLDPLAWQKEMKQPLRGWMLFSKIWGSWSHDTQLPDSDVDFVGVYVAHQRDLLGLHPPADTITHDKPDVQLHEVKKFCDLLLKGNPGIIEMLFTDKMLWFDTRWQPLRDARRTFLSKNVVKQYLGYSMAQLQRLEHGKPIHSKGGEYGLKWAYHMVRVGWDALRIARGGEPLLWKDGEEKAKIMEIRRGEWSKERVVKEASDTIAKVDALKPWPIPDDANEAFLNDWLLWIRGVDGDHESDKR